MKNDRIVCNTWSWLSFLCGNTKPLVLLVDDKYWSLSSEFRKQSLFHFHHFWCQLGNKNQRTSSNFLSMIMALQKNKEQGKIVRFNVDKRICSQVFFYHLHTFYPAGIYMINGNNRNTRTRCEICSNLIIKTPGVFIVNFDHISHLVLVNFNHISHLVLVFLLLTFSR